MFQYRTSRYVLIRIMKEKNIVLTDKNNEKNSRFEKCILELSSKLQLPVANSNDKNHDLLSLNRTVYIR